MLAENQVCHRLDGNRITSWIIIRKGVEVGIVQYHLTGLALVYEPGPFSDVDDEPLQVDDPNYGNGQQ